MSPFAENKEGLYEVGVTVKPDNNPSTPKQIIDPEHLLRAIENSMKRSDETSHGVTGISFKNYTITVRRRKALSWYIECKFKPVEKHQGRRTPRARRRLEHDND